MEILLCVSKMLKSTFVSFFTFNTPLALASSDILISWRNW